MYWESPFLYCGDNLCTVGSIYVLWGRILHCGNEFLHSVRSSRRAHGMAEVHEVPRAPPYNNDPAGVTAFVLHVGLYCGAPFLYCGDPMLYCGGAHSVLPGPMPVLWGQ